MRPLYLLVLGVVFLGGCARGPAGGEAPAVVRLAAAFAPEMVEDPAAVVEPERSEWLLGELREGWT